MIRILEPEVIKVFLCKKSEYYGTFDGFSKLTDKCTVKEIPGGRVRMKRYAYGRTD